MRTQSDSGSGNGTQGQNASVDQAYGNPADNMDEYLSEGELDGTTIDGRIWMKTITAKSIEMHPERASTKGRPVVCGRIAGIVRGIVEVPSDAKNPNSEKLQVLVGEISAESYNDDGEVFQFAGEWCGLPMGNNVVLNRLQQMVDDGSESPVVHFDYEFAAVPAGNPAGYSWRARNMMPVRVDATSFLSPQRMQQRLTRARAEGMPDYGRRQIEHQS